MKQAKCERESRRPTRVSRGLIAAAALLVLPAFGVVVLARGESDNRTLPSTRLDTTVRNAHDSSAPVAGASVPAAPLEAHADASAPAKVERPTAVALRTAQASEAREIYLQALKAPPPDAEQRDALLALAADPHASVSGRAVALDLLRRAPLVDAATIARIEAIATSSELDADTRIRAIDLLHQLERNRPDLESSLRGALLDAAQGAPTDEARALALDAVPLAQASTDDVARSSAWLASPSASVRASAARAVAGAPVRDRDLACGALERALASESDEDAASAEIEAALRAGRGGAGALLARLENDAIVRASAALARQIADYRTSLAAGETDPARIGQDHQAREEALLAVQNGGTH